MPEYAFDLTLSAVARVEANNESEAREKLYNYAACLDIGIVTPDGVSFTEASAVEPPKNYSLFEIDGEAT